MFATLASYVIAYVISSVCGLLATFALLPLLGLLRRHRALTPYARFLIDGFFTGLAVFLVAYLPTFTPLRAAYAMVLIPAVRLATNAFRRLDAAKEGRSGARALMEQDGTLADYDQVNDIRTERGTVIGIIVGYVLALFLFFPGRPFF